MNKLLTPTRMALHVTLMKVSTHDCWDAKKERAISFSVVTTEEISRQWENFYFTLLPRLWNLEWDPAGSNYIYISVSNWAHIIISSLRFKAYVYCLIWYIFVRKRDVLTQYKIIKEDWVTSETCFKEQYLIMGGLKVRVVKLGHDAVSHLE